MPNALAVVNNLINSANLFTCLVNPAASGSLPLPGSYSASINVVLLLNMLLNTSRSNTRHVTEPFALHVAARASPAIIKARSPNVCPGTIVATCFSSPSIVL